MTRIVWYREGWLGDQNRKGWEAGKGVSILKSINDLDITESMSCKTHVCIMKHMAMIGFVDWFRVKDMSHSFEEQLQIV